MKKIIGVVIIIFVCIAAFGACSREKVEYFAGRDTVASFGNGEYQILKGPDDALLLSNAKYNGFLLNDVLEYSEINNHFYVLGYLDHIPAFISVDLNTNHVRYHILVEKDKDSLYYNGKGKMVQDGVIIFYQNSAELTDEENEIISEMKEKSTDKKIKFF